MVRRNMGGCILPQGAVGEENVDPASDPIGSGPFQVDSWGQGSELELAAHDGYWEMESQRWIPLLFSQFRTRRLL